MSLDLIGSVSVPVLCGTAIGVVTAPNEKWHPGIARWYNNLVKAPFNPPNWLFGPVWTTLYVGMGVAAYVVENDGGVLSSYFPSHAIPSEDERRQMKWLYRLQLLLNFAWSPLFFSTRSPKKSLGLMVALWSCVAGLQTQFAQYNAFAGNVFAAYLAWVSFAMALNGYIVASN